MQDGLAIHEGMPAGDKLRGFDSVGWRIGRHGGAATWWDGVSSDMARLRRGEMACRVTWRGGDGLGWGAGWAKGEFVLLAPVKNQQFEG
jgi:hypothetical protein